MRDQYHIRRDYVYDRLVQMGFEVERPNGAFYMFPSIHKFGLDSSSFAYRLLEEQRVAVVPGNAFTPYGEGYIRLSYACSMSVLESAMDRLETFVAPL